MRHIGTSIGERLRGIRQSLGLTQREAAARAGMKHQYLSNLERGRIRNPSLETLARVARAYGMGVDELIGHGGCPRSTDLPKGLSELLRDPVWGAAVTPAWVETLLRVEHQGRRLRSKEEFLEAYLALRRILT